MNPADFLSLWECLNFAKKTKKNVQSTFRSVWNVTRSDSTELKMQTAMEPSSSSGTELVEGLAAVMGQWTPSASSAGGGVGVGVSPLEEMLWYAHETDGVHRSRVLPTPPLPLWTPGEGGGGPASPASHPKQWHWTLEASAESPRKRKHIRGSGIKICFASFSRSLFIMLENIGVLGCCSRIFFPPLPPTPHLPIDRSHYKINVTKIAHNASEKCNTISGSLSSF